VCWWAWNKPVVQAHGYPRFFRAGAGPFSERGGLLPIWKSIGSGMGGNGGFKFLARLPPELPDAIRASKNSGERRTMGASSLDSCLVFVQLDGSPINFIFFG